MREDDKARDRLMDETLQLCRQIVRKQASDKEMLQSRPDVQQEDAARLQAILDTTVDGIITINEDTIVQSFNKAAERIFGYTASEVIGKNVNMLMPSPYKENHNTYVANYLRTGNRKIIGIGREVVGRRKNGTTFPLYLAVSEVWVERGRLFTGILRDISELKQATEGIKSAARFPNESPFPILRIARDGKLLFANSSSDLLLQTWDCAVGQYLPDPWRSLIAESLRTGENKEFEVRCGNTTYSLVFTPVSNADDVDVNVYGSDITERKRLEEELQRANDQLELRVQRRTAELARAGVTMRDYARKLEYRNMELEEFTHIAAHDLQEPLRKIQTFADWVNGKYKGILDDEGQDRLKRLGSAADRMRTLVQALLAYSRLTGRSEAFEPVDLKALLKKITFDLETLIQETGGTVEIGDLPTIEADPVQMYHLFENLIDNALKFRSEASPHISIYSSDRPDGRCEIIVEDNGMGFDEKYLHLIFRPFQRLHKKEEYGGTGMGLTICRKVVDRHEGSITARSSPGKGATFIISLPIVQSKGEVSMCRECGFTSLEPATDSLSSMSKQ